MIEIVQNYINQHKLLSPGSKVIVGLSGGKDSMALLDLLILSGFQCIAAHCNFHLRGEESNHDAQFVKKWCKEIDIPFTSIDFNTTSYAKDRKISIEMAARELRYEWFEIIRRQSEAQAIAVAHHQDDSIETILLNLIRGTGIRGLIGIRPKNGKVIRPLLCVTRASITRYIEERNIPFVTDKSNEDDSYTRNFIRLKIMPLLQELNPSVKDALYRTSIHLTEVERIYGKSIQYKIKELYDGKTIDISKLQKSISPNAILFEILSPLGFNSSVIEDVCHAMSGSPGKQFYSKTHRLIKDRNAFLLNRLDSAFENNGPFYITETIIEITQPIHLTFQKILFPVKINKEKYRLYVDAEKLKYPLILRRWRQGDWFVPFGMSGRKKVSDYFTDQKFSLKEKEETWILLSGEEIVWIVGKRADNRFKLTEKSRQVLIVTMIS